MASAPINLGTPSGGSLPEKQNGIEGNISEIGIHHGKLFLALENIARPGEECVAIDVFEKQLHNIDRSGRGDYEKFLDNLNKYAVDPSRVVIKSLDFTSTETRKFFTERPPFEHFQSTAGTPFSMSFQSQPCLNPYWRMVVWFSSTTISTLTFQVSRRVLEDISAAALPRLRQLLVLEEKYF